MTELLTYKNLPVPYIAAWSNEHLPEPTVVTAADGIAFVDGLGPNGHAHGRDTAGVLWMRWALRRGDGKPEFNVVHAPRQKRAMWKLLCQVCGGPSDVNELGRLWLLEDNRDVEGWPEEEITTHPPLCLRCAPLAARLCTHLQDNVVAVRVGRVEVDCVYGDVYARSEGPFPVLVEKKQVVPLDDWRVKWMVGGQLAATLLDVTVVDLAELGGAVGKGGIPWSGNGSPVTAGSDASAPACQ
ncbi:hypothetical protein PV735_31960 [Streptomyces turgidiscabies]|nr:hypothetical protein [Streptomyces turgidiscabies]MDX3497268.1 hypothetical protein [Streptomyces turgidiscabies]GAQ68635.1 hypothetical protein T45_00347 [Streptomyces turgidiscabies]